MRAFCKRCGGEFEAENWRRVNCSVACYAEVRAKISRSQLRRLAPLGMDVADMARALGASTAGVEKALRTTGLHGVWRASRFPKMNSQALRLSRSAA